MIASLLLFAFALFLLVSGGSLLVRGASGLARRFGVSELVVGLTVVAFGTSAPELVLSLIAAARGEGEIAFGNVVGSNIANVGLILGTASLLRPLRVTPGLVTREIPMLILVSATALSLGLELGRPGAVRLIDRSDGIVLLLLFAAFLYYTSFTLRERSAPDSLVTELDGGDPPVSGDTRHALFVGGGLVLLLIGGELAVRSAVALAAALELPPALVGVTIVALGTSLPELSTSLVAAARGQDDLAVGNVVGSNLFNLGAVLGFSAVARPLPVPEGGVWDLAAMCVFALVLLPLSYTQRSIVRVEGSLLLAAYLAYIVLRATL